jgi:peptide chain release factor subunit 3
VIGCFVSAERNGANIEQKMSEAKIEQQGATEVLNEEDDSIEESGRKQKVEDVLSLLNAEDPREHMNVVFIGHVDAGKSTTAGQILFLTGGVDDRTIEKYEREAKEKNRESWYMAYIMDTNEEERAKASNLPL